MNKQGITCSVCSAQKLNLVVRKSKLMTDMKLYLCNECDEEGREPRYLIILVGRAKGGEHVSKYLKQKKYVGKEILAIELVK